MRRLGTRLSVDPMAVYHYFPNKGAVFDGVVELIWSSLRVDELDPAAPWQESVFTSMARVRATLIDHPAAISILGTRPIRSPTMFAILDRALGVITEAGLDLLSAVKLMNSVAAYTIGSVLAERGDPVGGDGADPASSSDIVAALPHDQFPHIAAAVRRGWSYVPDEQFEVGLRALINGWPLPSHAH